MQLLPRDSGYLEDESVADSSSFGSSLLGIDLFLNLFEQAGGGFDGLPAFNESIFTRATAERLVAQFTTSLRRYVADPHAPMGKASTQVKESTPDGSSDFATRSGTSSSESALDGGSDPAMRSGTPSSEGEETPLPPTSSSEAGEDSSSSAASCDGARQLVVAGSFTVDVVEARLYQTAHQLGASVRVAFAGFGQVMQSLLDPSSEFYANASGVNILLVRPKDLPDARELSDALRQYDRDARARAPVCLVVCPQLEAVDAAWASALAPVDSCAKVWRADADEFCTYGEVDLDEEYCERFSIPYSERLYAGVADAALRLASYATRRPFKLVCVDCDHTLWRGVVGEDGPGALQPCLALQRRLKRCSERGLMLVTCSKNALSDVEAAFTAHPEWPLALSDFVLHKVIHEHSRSLAPNSQPTHLCTLQPAPPSLHFSTQPTSRSPTQ